MNFIKLLWLILAFLIAFSAGALYASYKLDSKRDDLPTKEYKTPKNTPLIRLTDDFWQV
ncbi:hypothetical protein ACRW9N_02430 [Listeria aquatica]|uniref:hypothetical protein n=1 Tax=Listeria aquatica TaxID=1494960 RepID=UPI003EF4141D